MKIKLETTPKEQQKVKYIEMVFNHLGVAINILNNPLNNFKNLEEIEKDIKNYEENIKEEYKMFKEMVPKILAYEKFMSKRDITYLYRYTLTPRIYDEFVKKNKKPGIVIVSHSSNIYIKSRLIDIIRTYETDYEINYNSIEIFKTILKIYHEAVRKIKKFEKIKEEFENKEIIFEFEI